MKRPISSNTNSQDAGASQSKRTRPTTSSQPEEESVVDVNNDHVPSSSQQKSSKTKSHNSKAKPSNGSINRDNNSSGTTRTSSGSTISFSSSPSSLKSPPVATNNNTKSDPRINQSLQSPLNNSEPTHHSASNNVDRMAADPNPKTISKSLSHNMNQKKDSTYINSSTPRRSSPLNDSTSSINNQPIGLVEGSLEYRELKRMYLREKNDAEEWRKDYQIMKRQLAQLKSSTIPRPAAEAWEWLKELLDLMNNNGTFKGDGRTLEKLGEDLGLEGTVMVTVAARTPQKSALKLFRLLYPTINERARCRSISKIPKEQLQNIYLYVRCLHQNLSFSMNDMRRAIGTSIRSANADLRRMQRHQGHQFNQLHNFENHDPNEIDEQIQDDERDMQAVLGEDEDDSDDEVEEEEDGDDDIDDLMIDDEADED